MNLKQNAFWVGIGAAGVILLALFVLLILPLRSEATSLRGKIKLVSDKLNEKMPGDKDIDNWKVYRAKMVDSYDRIGTYYSASHAQLERWFPGFSEESDKGTFVTAYLVEIGKLEAALKERKVKIGIGDDPAQFGFNWEATGLNSTHWENMAKPPGKPGDEKRALKDLQKRFWLRKRVADVILVGNVKVNRIADFHFARALHPKIQSAPWDQRPNDEKLKYPNWPAQGSGTGFQEDVLSDKLGETITFGFALELPYSEAPRFIQEFLNPSFEAGGREGLLLSIIGSRLTIFDQNNEEETYSFTPSKNEQQQKEKEKHDEKVAPKDFLLLLTCQVIDFDATKLLHFDSKPSEN